MHTLLVTGGAGFIGSNFVRHVLATTELRVIVLDALTYAGNLESLADVEQQHGVGGDGRYRFVHGDIRDFDLVRPLVGGTRSTETAASSSTHHSPLTTHPIDAVVHFAAE